MDSAVRTPIQHTGQRVLSVSRRRTSTTVVNIIAAHIARSGVFLPAAERRRSICSFRGK